MQFREVGITGRNLIYLRESLVDIQFRELGMTGKKVVYSTE
jgi:hypothetical protein